MRRAQTVSMAAGSLLVLVSFYLPWWRTGRLGRISPFSPLPAFSIDGWTAPIAGIAALVALGLVVAAALELRRPGARGRLPLGWTALVLVYLAVAVVVATHAIERAESVGSLKAHLHVSYGIAVCGVGVALLLVGAAGRRPDRGRLLSFAPLAGLLVALLLPWTSLPGRSVLPGVDLPAAMVVPLLAVLAIAAPRRNRPLLAAAAVLCVAGAFSWISYPFDRAYGAWLGLAFAVALILATLPWAPARPTVTARGLLVMTAAGLLVVTLFLPWSRVCLGASSGGCYSGNGWTFAGTIAALLAVGVSTAELRGLRISVFEFALGLSLLVLSIRTSLVGQGPFERVERAPLLAYGAALALIVIGVALRQRRSELPPSRAVAAIVPYLACAAFLVLVALPWWDVAHYRLFGFTWFTFVLALTCLHLLFVWRRRIHGDAVSPLLLVAIPIAMLALTVVVLAPFRHVHWAGWTAFCLEALLLMVGRVEQNRSVGRPLVPEILRVDRL